MHEVGIPLFHAGELAFGLLEDAVGIAAVVQLRGKDAVCVHHLAEVIATLHLHRIEPVGTLGIIVVAYQLHTGNTLQRLVIELAVVNVSTDHIVDMLHLAKANGSIHIVHRILVAHLGDVVVQTALVLGKAKLTKSSCSVHLAAVTHSQETTINSGHVLDGLK